MHLQPKALKNGFKIKVHKSLKTIKLISANENDDWFSNAAILLLSNVVFWLNLI